MTRLYSPSLQYLALQMRTPKEQKFQTQFKVLGIKDRFVLPIPKYLTMVLVILHWQFLIKMALLLLIHKLDWSHSLVEKCRWTKHWLPWVKKDERSFQSWRNTKLDTKILPVSPINWSKISWQTIGRICSSGFFKCACWTQLWSNVVWAWSYSLQGMVQDNMD